MVPNLLEALSRGKLLDPFVCQCLVRVWGSNPEWETISARVGWLVKTRFRNNRSALAKAIGFSHTMIANVVKGETPGHRLQEAIITLLNVDPVWLKTGEGHPFTEDYWPEGGIPVANVLLPGPPLHHQALISHGWLVVPGILPSPSAYWLLLKSTQPILQKPAPGFRSRDHLLMETDRAKFPKEKELSGNLCVVRGGAGGTELLLAEVEYYPASIDSGDARLEADFHRNENEGKAVVEEIYRHYPNGEVHHTQRRLRCLENVNLISSLPVIRYTDIVSVWSTILHRPFG